MSVDPQPHVPILNPRSVRDERLVVVPLGNGTAVRARRLDVMSMVMEGMLPMPLLSAAQRWAETDEPAAAWGSPAIDVLSNDSGLPRVLELCSGRHTLSVLGIREH